MTRFNTGNNLNSLDERDFYDNCLSLDQAMNSTDPTWRDRFNVEKPTIDAALKSAGFMPAGFDFVTGGTLQPGDRNKAVYNPAPNGDNNWYRWNGVFPKEIAANSQPNPKNENNWVLAHFRIGIVEKEALRRTYLEVGLNLVEGSFEEGGVLVNSNDVLLQERTGKVFSGPIGTVAAGTNPTLPSSGYVSRTDVLLRNKLAAPGGASLVGPGMMTRGVDKFSIMQGRSGEHRQDTLTRGLAIELNEPITGSGYAGATNTYMFNRLFISDDKVDAVTDGTPGSKVDGLIVQHQFGGAGTRGGRHAAEFMLTQQGATEPDNTDRNYVGVVGYCATTSGDGGTNIDTDKRGGYFGGNFFTTIKNAQNVGHANGCESNVLIDAASSVYYRCGYSSVSGGENQGTKYDAAYAVGALGLNGARWRDGILMGAQNGRTPLSRSMIRGENLAISKVMSFKGDIPPDLITSDTDPRFNFRVDRLEMFYTNASLVIGSKTDNSNTPILRAYTDNSGNYAGQLIFSGSAAAKDGNGVCNIQFRQTTVRELVPSAPNTYLCGAASLPWSGGFTQTAFTVTSDERYKTAPLDITDVMLDAAAEVDWCMFQYLDRVEEKGADGARWHFGAIAQRFVEAFRKHGLDPFRFAFICHDEWAESPELIGEDGEVISHAVDAGSRYGIRYEQAIILKQKQIERDHKRQIDDLVARIEALEGN